MNLSPTGKEKPSSEPNHLAQSPLTSASLLRQKGMRASLQVPENTSCLLVELDQPKGNGFADMGLAAFGPAGVGSTAFTSQGVWL